eukprot:754841-Hanusia_phi.AAC.2
MAQACTSRREGIPTTGNGRTGSGTARELRYEGDWKEDMKHGVGVLKCKDGRIFECAAFAPCGDMT